ncbi:Scr1 family TA system antitoxin-like transcriptional regulator [Kitasatospora sp. NBC_00039]|uniref:Scr1 family TA system antitoxin-like transcriptional regulator n=1 Tax=Kitasatospora sp. NBC_00039 TaxID=2903565 RepID=UPI003255989D
MSIAKDDVQQAKAKARVRHPAWFRDFAGLEAEAVELHEYSSLVIPGLLQTEDHARSLYGMRQPLLSEEVIEIRVAARMARQEVLTRWPRAIFSWVIDESRPPPGGRPAVHPGPLPVPGEKSEAFSLPACYVRPVRA